MPPIYLDYNATTPVDPDVVEAMQPYLRADYGNPSSSHTYGQRPHDAVATARRQVADLIGASPEEIVFTGGGTEANNLAIKGLYFAHLFDSSNSTEKRRHIVTSAIEHPATINPCRFLEKLGCPISLLPVDECGTVSLNALEEALQQPPLLVTIMHANNEVGTIQPIAGIARKTHAAGGLVHTDAAQSAGKIPIDVREMDVDFLSIAGHKIYATKGIGALYIRRGIQVEPLIHGAAHENGRRGGTENVPAIVGLGVACQKAKEKLAAGSTALEDLRDRLWTRLHESLGDKVVLNGHTKNRLPNTLNVSFVGKLGAEVLAKTPGIAASTGSACHEGEIKLSPVLEAMGIPPEVGKGAVRLTLGRNTTEAEIDEAARLLFESVSSL